MRLFKAILIVVFSFSISLALQTSKQFNLLNKKNYKIIYDRDINSKDIQKISNDLDSVFRFWKSKLKVKQKGKIEFVIYKDDKSYKNRSGVNFNLPIYLNKGIVHISPVATDYRKQTYHSYLTQGVVLGILQEAYKRGCSKWLIDAFSVYVSKLGDVDAQVYNEVQHNIKDFQQEYSQLKKEAQYKAFIAKALSFINYLGSKYGEEKILLLFRKYDGKKTDEEVFEEVFGEKLGEIEKGWQIFLKRKQK